ncbi:MAG: hypothetical protein Q7S22_05380 [Candidatus Micrarchaeota archaeon]|nr:hypothetical protein [Candidatus Micrarchaeota archaeon]
MSTQPKTKRTPEGIKHAVGSGCSDGMVLAIINSDNPNKKLELVRDALNKLKATLTDENLSRAIYRLENSKYSTIFYKFFVADPTPFVEMALASSDNGLFMVFNSLSRLLEYEAASNLFSKDPAFFVEIAIATRQKAFSCFKHLSNTLSLAFMGNPNSFLELARVTKRGMDNILSFLALNPDALVLFSQKPEIVLIACRKIIDLNNNPEIIFTGLTSRKSQPFFLQYLNGEISTADIVLTLKKNIPENLQGATDVS